jgi:excisionase family DNA binding protein
MIASNERWVTPPTIAKRLAVTCDKVLTWIRSGQLRAVNLSDKGRPRWKISPEDLAAFLESKSNRVTAEPPTRKRRVIPKPARQWV